MLVKQPTASYGNPQKEDGYTPIANELLEAILKADFSKRQLLVIMAIARMTYGYSRKADALSGWQIASMINIDRSHVSKTLNELHELNVINKLETGRESHGVLVNEIQINKKYKEWLTVAKTATVANSATVAKTATVTVAKTATEPLPKQPTHKAIKTNKAIVSDFETFWNKYPRKEVKKKAKEIWLRVKPNVDEVLKALQWQIKSNGWQRGFIPLATTYLNQERWTDEPFTQAQEKNEDDWKKKML